MAQQNLFTHIRRDTKITNLRVTNTNKIPHIRSLEEPLAGTLTSLNTGMNSNLYYGNGEQWIAITNNNSIVTPSLAQVLNTGNKVGGKNISSDNGNSVLSLQDFKIAMITGGTFDVLADNIILKTSSNNPITLQPGSGGAGSTRLDGNLVKSYSSYQATDAGIQLEPVQTHLINSGSETGSFALTPFQIDIGTLIHIFNNSGQDATLTGNTITSGTGGTFFSDGSVYRRV